MGGVHGAAGSGGEDSDEEEAEVHFHLRGRRPPPPPPMPPPSAEEEEEDDEDESAKPDEKNGQQTSAASTNTPAESSSAKVQDNANTGTEGLRQRKKGDRQSTPKGGDKQSPKKGDKQATKQEAVKNDSGSASTDADAEATAREQAEQLRQMTQPTGPKWSALVKLLVFIVVCLACAVYTAPLEDSFKQMRDERYVKPVVVKERYEFEFQDTEGDMIKIKREKNKKSGKFCINEYVNGSLDAYNLRRFDIDVEKRTYRDAEYSGSFKPTEDLEELKKLRDKMFEELEFSFMDSEKDIISVKRERSIHKSCGHSINLYVNGKIEDTEIKKFEIDVTRRTYSERLGEGRFLEQEDLSKLVPIRNQMFGLNASKEPELPPSTWSSWIEDYMPLDRSFQGHVAWSRYVSHGPFAFATIALSVPPTRSDKKKKDSEGAAAASVHKMYWHRYLGIFGCWVPVPYLPLPGNKENTFGVGFCVAGHCACMPDYFSKAEKKGRSCWKFTGGRSAALKFFLIPTVILYILFAYQVVYPKIFQLGFLLTTWNLYRGRLWVVFFAPFVHLQLKTAITSSIFFASAVDGFSNATEATDVSFGVICLLLLGGCWCSWLARVVLWQGFLRGSRMNFLYVPEHGAMGGIVAILTFLLLAYPEEPCQFNVYFFTLPFTLCAWQSFLVHAVTIIVLRVQEVVANISTYKRGEAIEIWNTDTDAWVPGVVVQREPDGTVHVQEGIGYKRVAKLDIPRALRKLMNQRDEVVNAVVDETSAYVAALVFGAFVYSAWRPHLAVST